MEARETDTIAAISTPVGEGGIGIIRVSGSLSLDIAERLFQPSGAQKPSSFPSHTLHHGYIIDPEGGERIDEVLLSVMRAPHTYTTEDTIEINGHGGLTPLRRILELVLQEGARLAAPGEFTQRAFLHGRIDLAQAEAVIEIVRSKSERSLRLAMRHLEGSLSRRIGEWRGRLISLLAEIEAALDFPEEDLETLSREEMEREIGRMQGEIKGLEAGFREGRLLQEGIVSPLIGRSNVGKSSLFNALLQREKAIVTPCPGTTRDPLEAWLHLQGLPFLLVDTAGLRGEEPDLGMAEKEGLVRSRGWMERADLLLLLVDGSEPLTEEDLRLLEMPRGRVGLLLVTKADLPQELREEELKRLWPDSPYLRVSAKTGMGLEALKEAMVGTMERNGLDLTQGLVITHLQHLKALEEAGGALSRGKQSLASGLSPEFVSMDLRESLDALGRITGETASSDLLSEIFSRFCIGK